MRLKVENCRKCHQDKPIVNRKYGLCESCNWERLHPEGDSYQDHRMRQQSTLLSKMVESAATIDKSKERKVYKIKSISEKQKVVIKRDEEVYEEVWNSKEHYCEECGCHLGDDFRDENGKVVDRFRYSHILGKDLYPEHRHNIHNFNLLCFKCHQVWEYGDKVGMDIYNPNQLIIKELKGIC